MKRILPIWAAIVFGTGTAAAQDLIVKTDAGRIEARVTEISPDAVRYKRFSNPDGPTYVLPVSEIDYILYPNGERDTFKKPDPERPAPAGQEADRECVAPDAGYAEAAEPDAGATPAGKAETAVRTAEPAPHTGSAREYRDSDFPARGYEIGDLYERDGVRGIVCYVSDEGRHGLVLSADETSLPWSLFRKPDLRTVGADNRSDGAANMETVARYIAENGLSWEDFPAFQWCRELGEGWYLPSLDELLAIGVVFNGGMRAPLNRAARNRFNGVLKSAGGKTLDRLVYYFSSTEANDKDAYTSQMSTEPPYVIEIPKHNKFLIRAVHKF